MFAAAKSTGIEVRVGIGHRVGDGPAGREDAEGAAIAMVGAVLSTVKVVLGPAAGASCRPGPGGPRRDGNPQGAVALMLLMVTVRVWPEPETLSVPLAVPVLFRVMFPAARVLELKFASA